MQVVQVGEHGFGEQVVTEIQVADLGRRDGLAARRQRRVANGERIVVVEVAKLLFLGERPTEHVHREHEVGLLDHLFAVQVVVRIVQQQWVFADRRREIPRTEQRECLALLVHAQSFVERDRHVIGTRFPVRRFGIRHAVLLREVGSAMHPRHTVAKCQLRSEIGEHVVVDDGGVLVGAGHAVEAEASVDVVMPETGEQAGDLDEEFDAALGFELFVLGGAHVSRGRVGDVGADVHTRGTSGPVARTLVAVDGAPGEHGPALSEFSCA